VVDAAVLDTVRSLQDKKTALMSQQGSSSTTAAPLLTASTARVVQPVANETAQPSSPALATASRGRYTNTEWDNERKSFKRYDTVAQKWEHRGTDGVWRASE
jgi:hypothetical protein